MKKCQLGNPAMCSAVLLYYYLHGLSYEGWLFAECIIVAPYLTFSSFFQIGACFPINLGEGVTL
jgi:hypothetical protein